MTFDQWLADEFPGGVDPERAEDMRIAWDAAMRLHLPRIVPLRPQPTTPLTPCIGVPVRDTRSEDA